MKRRESGVVMRWLYEEKGGEFSGDEEGIV